MPILPSLGNFRQIGHDLQARYRQLQLSRPVQPDVQHPDSIRTSTQLPHHQQSYQAIFNGRTPQHSPAQSSVETDTRAQPDAPEASSHTTAAFLQPLEDRHKLLFLRQIQGGKDAELLLNSSCKDEACHTNQTYIADKAHELYNERLSLIRARVPRLQSRPASENLTRTDLMMGEVVHKDAGFMAYLHPFTQHGITNTEAEALLDKQSETLAALVKKQESHTGIVGAKEWNLHEIALEPNAENSEYLLANELLKSTSIITSHPEPIQERRRPDTPIPESLENENMRFPFQFQERSQMSTERYLFEGIVALELYRHNPVYFPRQNQVVEPSIIRGSLQIPIMTNVVNNALHKLSVDAVTYNQIMLSNIFRRH